LQSSLNSLLHEPVISIFRSFVHFHFRSFSTEHWLPISQRITFNIALMMFDCSRGRSPKYFADVHTPVHTVMCTLLYT